MLPFYSARAEENRRITCDNDFVMDVELIGGDARPGMAMQHSFLSVTWGSLVELGPAGDPSKMGPK